MNTDRVCLQALPDPKLLLEENERLKAELASLKEAAQADEGPPGPADAQYPPDANDRSKRVEHAHIPPRPHTIGPDTDTFARRNSDGDGGMRGEPPEGGSLEAIMAWRKRHGRGALSSAGSSSEDFGPPRLRQRSWLSKNPLSTKPNPVRSQFSFSCIVHKRRQTS